MPATKRAWINHIKQIISIVIINLRYIQLDRRLQLKIVIILEELKPKGLKMLHLVIENHNSHHLSENNLAQLKNIFLMEKAIWRLQKVQTEATVGHYIWAIPNRYTKIQRNKAYKKIPFMKNYSFLEIKGYKVLIS